MTDHIALLASTLAATTILAKMWTVCHGNLLGMAAVIASGGLASFLGAFVAGLPAVGVVSIIASGVLLPEAIREGDQLRGPVLGTGAGVLVSFALAPRRWFLLGAFWLVIMIVLSCLIVAARARWRRRTSRPVPWVLKKSDSPQDVHPLVALVVLGVLTWAAVATSDRPWLPPEDITMHTGRVVTGYVLDDSGGLLVLEDKNRTVIRLSEGNVEKRVICSVDSSPTNSLLSTIIWSAPSAYPSCSGS